MTIPQPHITAGSPLARSYELIPYPEHVTRGHGRLLVALLGPETKNGELLLAWCCRLTWLATSRSQYLPDLFHFSFVLPCSVDQDEVAYLALDAMADPDTYPLRLTPVQRSWAEFHGKHCRALVGGTRTLAALRVPGEDR